MGEIEDLRAELAAQQEQQELLKLKEELAKIKRENAALETKAGGAGGTPATPAAAPPKKKKSKKAKKAPSAEEAAELAALQKELAAVTGETSRLESGDAKPAARLAGGGPQVRRRLRLRRHARQVLRHRSRTFGDEDALQRALNLDGSAYEDDERCRLKGCAVANLRYHTDADTGNFRGFCHVEFEDEASLEAALACAGTKWRGRDLRISHSETAKKRPAEGGKGGKGGRGRGGAKKQRAAAARRG
ncbi:RNA binding-protein [Aureococcus anophagefferens]|nr:RNA binding-protein [Aureococcus anophagefferens]